MSVSLNTWTKCTRKKAHKTLRTANRHKRRLEKNGETNITTYQCPVCGYWHVGHRSH